MTEQKSNWWRSTDRSAIYLRWSVLVALNAAYPFFLSLMMVKTTSQLIGIAFGILSFIIIYAETESYFLERNYTTLAAQLRLGAAIKISTVLLPFIDMITGSIALGITHQLTGVDLSSSIKRIRTEDNLSQLIDPMLNLVELGTSYMTTLIDGFLLSIIVAMIIGLIRLIIHWRNVHREKHQSQLTQ